MPNKGDYPVRHKFMDLLSAKSEDILLATDCGSTKENIINYLGGECFFHLPQSLDDVVDEPFIDASVAILDDGFMGGRGLEVLKRIKGVKPSMPVLYLAREGSEELCLQVFRLGARDYFAMPFDIRAVTKSLVGIMAAVSNNKRFRSLPMFENEDFSDKPGQADLKKVEKVRCFLEQNYNKDLSLDFLASVASMSKFHFARSFKKLTGLTCCQYLRGTRMREARRLLISSPFSVSEICFAVGYHDLTYFERVFKKAEGGSPSAYRRKFK